MFGTLSNASSNPGLEIAFCPNVHWPSVLVGLDFLRQICTSVHCEMIEVRCTIGGISDGLNRSEPE